MLDSTLNLVTQNTVKASAHATASMFGGSTTSNHLHVGSIMMSRYVLEALSKPKKGTHKVDVDLGETMLWKPLVSVYVLGQGGPHFLGCHQSPRGLGGDGLGWAILWKAVKEGNKLE